MHHRHETRFSRVNAMEVGNSVMYVGEGRSPFPFLLFPGESLPVHRIRKMVPMKARVKISLISCASKPSIKPRGGRGSLF